MISLKNKIILLYNKVHKMKPDEEYTYELENDFVLTTERRYIDVAVAIVFYMPEISRDEFQQIVTMKNNRQIWVYWSLECELHYQWQHDHDVLKYFEIKCTYRFDSDIPAPSITPARIKVLRQEPKPKSEFICAFISSDYDLSHRRKVMDELMQYVSIDSFGSYRKNKVLTDDRGEETKLEVISKYKFTIAFENAKAKDYVTEKFFQPLIVGSVPVYLGAPNIDDFAPGDNCFINVESFGTIRSLAEYLNWLDKNSAEYEKLLDWKKAPYRDVFETKLKLLETGQLKKLCDMIDSGVTVTPI